VIHAAIDHLVVTAPSLASGAAYIRNELGVEMQPGGEHPAMGTHNLLLKLDHSTYLEVLAINPDATAPGTPRWFGLDGVTEPGLAAWVARVDDIDAAAAALGMPSECIKSMSRGDLKWSITIPDNGGSSTMPALIQWRNGPHPATRLPDSGCALVELTIPFAERLLRLNLDSRCAPGPELRVTIQTPHGVRTLRTPTRP